LSGRTGAVGAPSARPAASGEVPDQRGGEATSGATRGRYNWLEAEGGSCM
jgi:hypothetical protein